MHAATNVLQKRCVEIGLDLLHMRMHLGPTLGAVVGEFVGPLRKRDCGAESPDHSGLEHLAQPFDVRRDIGV